MAEKRTIELEVKSNLDESTESVKSLKAQLKELKALVSYTKAFFCSLLFNLKQCSE